MINISAGVRYGIVGNGRMARHFSQYLLELNLPFETWNRSMESAVGEALENCSHILYLISDDAIADFHSQHFKDSQKTFVHFSGALTLDGIFGAHPLMTFGVETYEPDVYLQMPFICDFPSHGFEAVLPGLENPRWTLSPDKKSLYHSLCVTSGNFSAILCSAVLNKFEDELDLPKEVLVPYMQQTLKNVFSDPNKNLTGPLIRQDQKTMKLNLKALDHDPLSELYRAFQDYYPKTQEGDSEHS